MSIVHSRFAVIGEEELGFDSYRQVKCNGKVVDKIEIEIYENIPEKPEYVRLVGMRKIDEILDELNKKLKELEMLPDESGGFSLWNNYGEDIGKEFPDYRWISCYPVTGGSEGHWLHIGVITNEPGFGIKHLFLAKTLREGRDGMDYAAEICKIVGLLLHA